MDKIIFPGEVAGEVEPPSSKSYAQRAIAAALLAGGISTLHNVGMCDDTASALRVVQVLGARVEGVEGTGGSDYRITGGLNPVRGILDIGESGLSTRLFAPIASLFRDPVTITGHGTILSRPMDAMLAPLRELGVEVTDNKGFLPITVRGPVRGGETEIDGSVSSQFLTGLLVALPLAECDTTVRVRGLKSIPYIDMTIDVMDRFGVAIDHRDYEEFYVPGSQRYTPADFTIEGDWSAASCLLVAGATSGSVTVRNLNPVSLQADVRIIDALSMAGARIEQDPGRITVCRRELRAFEFDATDCPDLFPALAALAASCEGTSTIIGTDRLLHKECDRAEAIFSEYGKLGIEVDISEENVMRITRGGTGGGEHIHGDLLLSGNNDIIVESHRDHRMAMSLAVAALNAPVPVTIRDAECVSKSYTDFWMDYERLRA